MRPSRSRSRLRRRPRRAPPLPPWHRLAAGATAAGALHLAGGSSELALVAAAPRASAERPERAPAALAVPAEPGAQRVRAMPQLASVAPAATPLAAEPAARPLDPRIAGWIAELADDDVRWNATRAVVELVRAGAAAIPALQRALDSPDRQQRQLAAGVLRRLDAPPSERLLAVTVEGLRYDALPWDGRHYTEVGRNETEGTRWLVPHARRVEEALARGLDSPDGQERFLCAFLLGKGGSPRALGRTCEILIGHLPDNRVRGDALMAVNALAGLGGLALPYLVLAERDADEQALSLLRLLQLDLADPPRTRAALAERRRMQRVTRVYADPAIELDLVRSGLPAFAGALSDGPPAR